MTIYRSNKTEMPPPPSTNSEMPRTKGEKRSPIMRSAHSLPVKKPIHATASFTTKPYPEFNFRHKFSLLVVGPSQRGKTYFVQHILENNRIVYEEQRNIRIFWCYNQWQDRYDKLRISIGKSVRFEYSTGDEPATVSGIKAGRRQPKHHQDITWSDATIPEWQNYTLGAQAVRNIPEGYAIIEMYRSSRSNFDPSHPGVYINGENYWPVKIRHPSTGRMKWMNLRENEPTVRAFVKDTTKPKLYRVYQKKGDL